MKNQIIIACFITFTTIMISSSQKTWYHPVLHYTMQQINTSQLQKKSTSIFELTCHEINDYIQKTDHVENQISDLALKSKEQLVYSLQSNKRVIMLTILYKNIGTCIMQLINDL